MVDRFLKLYQPAPPRWDNLTSVVSELEWPEVTSQTTLEYLEDQGIDGLFSRELVVPNEGEHLQPATTALHLELLFQAMGRACYSTRDSSTMHLRDLVHPPGRWPIF